MFGDFLFKEVFNAKVETQYQHGISGHGGGAGTDYETYERDRISIRSGVSVENGVERYDHLP